MCAFLFGIFNIFPFLRITCIILQNSAWEKQQNILNNKRDVDYIYPSAFEGCSSVEMVTSLELLP